MFFKKLYYFSPMVQFDEKDNPCICGCKVMWLDSVTVEARSFKKAEKKFWELIEERYPEYKGGLSYM